MLNQRAFEQQFNPEWVELDACLTQLESNRPFKKNNKDISQLPSLYSAVCQHHAIATSRGYSHALNSTLHHLMVRAHHQLYRHKGHWLSRCIHFFGGGFPQALRKEAKLFAFSCLLFFGTALLCGALSAYSTDYADLMLGSKQRISMEEMYNPDNDLIRQDGLEEESNFVMFGLYIMNNIGIDFRVFASGIVFGIGSALVTLFNGVSIGAVAGHLSALGYYETFWGFVAGHSAPELIALCISCTSGLMLGRALINPGRQTRRLALLRSAQQSVPLILGAALLTLLAAFIEAYWSSQELPFMLKISVGVAMWVAISAYLLFAGKRSA